MASPSELILTQVTPREGRREARVGSLNIAGAKSGVMDKGRIAFSYKEVRPGVYLVETEQPLEAGEYGFLYALSGSGSAGAMTARIFDFSVN
ncbi:hypothetical protein HT136_23000 [Novosphingobium profundi]|uniref:hypothetical protein n=1 Tax=Novosphingobium profundi TaxID=1774954 RepID=UPI001BDAB78E|nr:hypothetical protein [Novosphingobium profundi]MBT0671243.1 hypothetical protein [Novosphingobium profundi]